MEFKKNLVLLGMMGSGKSTIGKLIAKKLNAKFIDIDKVIEKETNMTITKIFLEKGETFFRNLEEKTSLNLLNSHDNIISLGGGGFINNEIKKKVLSNSLSFWLSCNTYTLLNRIKKSKKRPLVFNLDDNEIIHLITKRSKIYSKAHFKIRCNKLSKNEIVKKIIKLYEAN